MNVVKKGNEQVIKMLSLSEEISNINRKVNQLVQDLQGAGGVIDLSFTFVPVSNTSVSAVNVLLATSTAADETPTVCLVQPKGTS